ncbi:MAG: MerR family transcriptional regulator [Oscillospiraceae bacterium]|nr:MerR family transcriptional regulator [Oscillospiraceae bacterium]MBR3556051.1 MerR family transcriptional regulator [Oscillospiraceae bacterium]
MKIKEVAKATGLTEKTIRYYENRGLVIPQARELNGRSFRDYSPENVAALKAVSTLRRARFPVEEIVRMQKDPESIGEVIRDYEDSVEEAYASLGRIRELLRQEDLGSSADIYALADRLRPATEGIPLPKQDLHFRFKEMERVQAKTQEGVRSLPEGLRFGWTTLYHGKDRNRYEEMQTSLRLAGIPFRALTYNYTQRLAGQGLANMGNSMNYGRAPTPTNYKLQAEMLSSDKLDSYTIEVRKKDAIRANAAIRELK